MSEIRAWARGPFELLYHADSLMRTGEEFGRRIALVNFDNAIEVSIRSYLSLHPVQRDGKTYQASEVAAWCQNFHTLLDFFFDRYLEVDSSRPFDKADLVHYHRVRNEQYHGGTLNLPSMDDILGARKAALWIFSALYHVEDCEEAILSRITQALPPMRVAKSELIDFLLDNNSEPIRIYGIEFTPSEALYKLDPDAYVEIGNQLKDDQPQTNRRGKLA